MADLTSRSQMRMVHANNPDKLIKEIERLKGENEKLRGWLKILTNEECSWRDYESAYQQAQTELNQKGRE